MLSNYTGSAALKVNFKSTAMPVKLEAVLIHLSAAATCATTVPLTISKYSSALVHNTVLLTQVMSSLSDVIYVPDAPIQINPDEKLNLSWVNDASSYKTWGAQIQYSAV